MEKPGDSNTNIDKITPDPTALDPRLTTAGDLVDTAHGAPDAITQPQYEIPGHVVEGSSGVERNPQPAPTVAQRRVGATALAEARPPGRMEALADEAARVGKLAVNGLRIGVAKLRHGRATRKAEGKEKLEKDFSVAANAALRVAELKTLREQAATTPKKRTRMRGETLAEFTERTGNAKEDMVQGSIPKLKGKVKLPETWRGRRHQKRVAEKIEKAGYSEVAATIMHARDKKTGMKPIPGSKPKASQEVDEALEALKGNDKHALRKGRHARRKERVGGKLEELRAQRAELKGEAYSPPGSEAPVEPPKYKGPEKSRLEAYGKDERDYDELVAILRDQGVEGAGFNAAINAKQTIGALTSGDLGGKIAPGETTNGGPTQETWLKLAQRRHIAKSLGLKLGSVWVDRNKQRINSEVSVPEKKDLTPRPTWDSKLHSYVDYRGRTLSTEAATSLISAHYLADNPDKFSKPEGFQLAAASVMDQASRNGAIVIESGEPDLKGRIVFERQMAQALGYEVGSVKIDSTGTATITVKPAPWMAKGETGSVDTLTEKLAPLGNVVEKEVEPDDDEDLDRQVDRLVEAAAQLIRARNAGRK